MGTMQASASRTLTVRAVVDTFGGDHVRVTLAGGEPALERLVSAVGTLNDADDMAKQRPNSLIIVPPRIAGSGDIGLDLLLRRAAAVRVSCLVVDAGDMPLPASTQRLAEQFHIALWREPRLDPAALRSRIEHLVRDPDLVGARVVRTVSEQMTRPAHDFGEIIDRLTNAIDHPTALIGPDGRTVAGATVAEPERLAAELSTLDPGIRDIVIDGEAGQSVLLTTAFPLVADQPRFWLATTVPRGLDSRGSHVLTALRIAALALSTTLVQTSLLYERDNREAGALLDDILRRAERLGVADVERATALGWQLFGWHVAVQVSSRGTVTELPTATLARSLAQALANQGLEGRPVRLSDAIVFWATSSEAPPATQLEALVGSVRTALENVERSYPGIRLRAGVGTPREGVSGIARSLADARHALAFAESGQGSAVVQRSDTMTANRLIRSWLPDGAARSVVAAIIEPLRRADSDGHLVATLTTYLDLESNASDTASALHVHRNTVIQRLRRIRELLEVDLDDPNDRLAVQVALRVGVVRPIGDHASVAAAPERPASRTV